MTILFVTHDIDESVYLSDRIVVLSPSPTEVREILDVGLPQPRDQVATKELQEFAHLRAHVYRLIKRAGRRRRRRTLRRRPEARLLPRSARSRSGSSSR